MALKVGFVGMPRVTGFAEAFRTQSDVEIYAGCDVNAETLEHYGSRLGLTHLYTDYEAFLDSGVEVVIVGTPMPFHTIQAAAALRRNIHVLSEVPAIVDLTQAWQLAEAARSTSAIYMMAENYCYMRSIGIVREMVAQGLFGDVYYGEGEYLHELKELNEITRWRRIWQTGINGVTYCTHSLGPVLTWIKDRVVSVTCTGSGHHYKDPCGYFYENEDSCSMDCKLSRGGQARIRVDMLSNRPHQMAYYSLQGTKGVFEAARSSLDTAKVWLADKSNDPNTWQPLSEYADEFMPADWKKWEQQAVKAGHGGGDFLQIMDFLGAVRGERPCPIDAFTALDFSVPGLVSQESILCGGIPLPVPDFRTVRRFPEDLPVELQNAAILRFADENGQPTWTPEGNI